MSKTMVRNNNEFFFNLYQKLNKELLEGILDVELDELLLENYYLGQKIDLYSKITGTTTEVFIESMLYRSDKRHLDFLMKLIDSIENNAIIIFQAESFTDKILEKIIGKIRKLNKTIDFYTIEIDKRLIKEVKNLKDIHFLKVIEKLYQIEVSNPFNVVEKYTSVNEHGIREGIEKRNISRVEGRNKILINEIRKNLYYFPTVFREKRCIDNRILSYSAGKSDVNYFISVEDRNGDSFVSVEFSRETENIYRKVKRRRQSFRQRIGYDVKFDDLNFIIRTELIDKHFIYKTIDDLAEVFDKYVFYLSNYIFYYGTNMEDSMWNQHKEGTL